MSFSPDIFKKKLDSLQETQDSIVSISQWVLFHHRRVKELCELWSGYTLSDNPKLTSKKKLSLLYLCNDVVQQARHKRKPEFSVEFAKSLPQVLNKVYPSLDDPIKPKIDRLIGVWEQRGIFGASDIRKMRKAVDLSKSGRRLNDDGATATADPSPVARAQLSGPKLNSELLHLNNLYNHMSQLAEVCNSNLTQIGTQSKQYLPNDHADQDALPSPKIYISKLNVFEKLCDVTSQNLKDIKTARRDILTSLASLQRVIEEGLTTDESKEKIIQDRLEKSRSTRSSLEEMLDEEAAQEPSGAEIEAEEEEESPAFDSGSPPPTAKDDDALPTYENSDSDDDDDDAPPVKRRKASDSSTSSSASGKKSVAFSEDIQIKEYDREEETDIIKIAKSDTESDDDDTNFEPSLPEDLEEFEAHHKDDLELRKAHHGDHQLSSTDSNGTGEGSTGNDNDDQKSGLLSLLSKLS
ncbi:hypothetical protein CJJ07_003748 [Candidozyma auris]|nr:hypothetical protein CJJ07_003748 [[Candida] auris]QEL61375.1 hypothetical protein CJJ09_003516 [[Candida] auris]